MIINDVFYWLRHGTDVLNESLTNVRKNTEVYFRKEKSNSYSSSWLSMMSFIGLDMEQMSSMKVSQMKERTLKSIVANRLNSDSSSWLAMMSLIGWDMEQMSSMKV